MPSGEVPAVRLVKVPDAAPPYDCETHGAWCPAARDAAGRREPTAGPASAGQLAVAVRPAASAQGQRSCPPTVRPGAAPSAADPTAGLPPQFAQVIAEILAGVRPPGQIVPWTTDRARAQIRRLTPLLASDRRPRIQRIITSRPAFCVVEMTVIVNFGSRSRALALRLEHVAARQAAPGRPARPARWLCTAIEAG